MKKVFLAFFLSLLSITAFTQSGTNSPYSQYGLGVLTDNGTGFNRAMNGVGVGISQHGQVNYLNPASYAQTDSLTFIFDMGMSLQLTNFKEGSVRKNAKNADFEHAVGAFRVARNLGMGFGIIPFTNVGYNYSSVNVASDKTTGDEIAYSNVYTGSGGIHEIFLGIGWMPIKNFSIGVNGGYLWGDYERIMSSVYNDNYVNTLTRTSSVHVSNYKLDFGAQFSFDLGKKDKVTIGATYGLKHKLGADPRIDVVSTNAQTLVADTTTFIARNGIELPEQIAGGLSWSHDNKWILAADYTLQRWGEALFPKYTNGAGGVEYVASKHVLKDRHKVAFGGEYCQNAQGRSFASRIRYRFGASYATPYVKVNGADGPKEISVSAGFGIPIVNSFNNRSILNVSAQWVHASAKNLITENTFRINLGLTFNERWFAKWKFE